MPKPPPDPPDPLPDPVSEEPAGETRGFASLGAAVALMVFIVTMYLIHTCAHASVYETCITHHAVHDCAELKP